MIHLYRLCAGLQSGGSYRVGQSFLPVKEYPGYQDKGSAADMRHGTTQGARTDLASIDAMSQARTAELTSNAV